MEWISCARTLHEAKVKDPSFVDWACERKGRFRFIVYQGMGAMDKSIDELELKTLTANLLKGRGYNTINSVVSDIDGGADFCKIPRMGRRSASEFMLKLFLYTYENLKPEKRKAYLEKVRGMN